MSSWSSQSSSFSFDAANRASRSPANTFPISGSPRSSPLTRPQWPWTSHSHRPLRSSSTLPGSPSPASSVMTAVPTREDRLLDAAHWSQTSRNTSSVASMQSNGPAVSDEPLTRQWSFTAFEWTIRNVKALREFVEGSAGTLDANAPSESSDDEDNRGPDVLRECPVIGDNKFKVEVARSVPLEDRPTTPTSNPVYPHLEPPASVVLPSLSLYVTSLFLDFAPPEYEFYAALMVAIKCQQDRAGEKGARSDWVWEHWEQEFVFRKESEFWECQLPSLSALLANRRIDATDSFVLCIQIHSPVGPIYPQFPQAYYVPKDLLEGLESSLDNPNTGDVRFITLEHLSSTSTLNDDPHHSRRSSSSSSHQTHTTARKRIIYAHSDILKRRSEYFATMLSSSFSEANASQNMTSHTDPLQPSRKIYDIVLLEADFVNVYWMLKWLYADWLLFREEDDPREVTATLGDGWSARWLNQHPSSIHSEWDWKTIPRNGPGEHSGPAYQDSSDSAGSRDLDEDGIARSSRSIRSVSAQSSPSMGDSESLNSTNKAKVPAFNSRGPNTSAGIRGGRSGAGSTSRGGMSSSTSPTSRRTTLPATKTTIQTSSTPSKPGSRPHFSNSTLGGPSALSPVSPRQPRHPSHGHAYGHPNALALTPQPLPDPHPHPTPELPPASALSIYQIAHRYTMPGLQALALEHMMNTITPKSSFPLLLATHFLDELHGLVEDYIVEHFDVVSRCEVFDHCCEEVAAGEWGAEGGKTLAALFRRLTSPSLNRYRS